MNVGDMTNRQSDLALSLGKLVQLSQEMLQAAREDNWEFVVSTEATRRPDLEAFFNAWHLSQKSVDVDVVRSSTEKIRQIDKEIRQLAEHSKQEICASLNQLTSSKQAAKAYIKNSI